MLFDYTYVGEKGTPCSHCHAQTVDDVMLTGHSNAYTDLDAESAANPYCLQCHTTGWDRAVTFDGTWAMDNPDTNGYDDYFDMVGDEAEERRMALAGVQCESCHGAMGPDFNDHRPLVSFATVVGPNFPDDIVSPCADCHSSQFSEEEYVISGHAAAAGGDLTAFNAEHYAHLASCNGCHTSEGFVRDNDPALSTYEFGETVNFIGCVTCHDPHMGEDGEGNEAQLRNVGAVEVAYTFPYAAGDAEVPRMEDKGTAQVCAQCHHGRRDTDNVMSQIDIGTTHFGPHSSAQMDMYIGGGSYEIPMMDYDNTHAHGTISNACVACHMEREVEVHGELQDHAFHSFAPNPENCLPCHTIDDFDYNGGQTAVEGLMNDLATRFGYTDYHDMEENWDSTVATIEDWEREAAYALYFLIGDGSKGVHNPTYATALMTNAITHYDANATP